MKLYSAQMVQSSGTGLQELEGLLSSKLEEQNEGNGAYRVATFHLSMYWWCRFMLRGRTYAKKLRFLRKKWAGYANLKMQCVYCTQKTVTSHIYMRLVFSFFAHSREGL